MYRIREEYGDCGIAFVRQFSPEFYRLEQEIETIMKRCQEIDPEAPQTYLKQGEHR